MRTCAQQASQGNIDAPEEGVLLRGNKDGEGSVYAAAGRESDGSNSEGVVGMGAGDGDGGK